MRSPAHWALGALVALAVLSLPVPVSIMGTAAVAFLALVFVSPRRALLLWLLTTPVLSHWIEVPLGAGIPDVTYDRGFVTVMLLVILVRQRLGLEASFRVGSTEIAMAIFLLVAGLSLVKSDDLPRDLQLLVDSYGVPFLLYWIARSLFTRSSISSLPAALALLGLILVGLGAVQLAIGRVPGLPEGARRLHGDRMTSAFINAAEFGGVVAMTGCACLAAAAFARSLAGRWALLGAAAVHLVGAGLSLTRAAWVATVAGVGVLAWRNATARRLVGWSALAAAVAGVVAVPFLLEAHALEARAGEEAPIFNRIVSLVTALRMWLDRPLLGFGFGRYVYAEHSRDYLTPVGSIAAEWGAAVFVPHNEFLHTLVMTGAVGLACYVVVLRNAYRAAAAWSTLDEGSGRWLGLALGAALAIYVVDGAFADLIFFEYHAMLFFLLFGAAEGLLDRRAAPAPEPMVRWRSLEASPAPH